jgi:hypothetical protein
MPHDERDGHGGPERALGGLLAAWAAYWAALLVVALWKPAVLFFRLKQQMPGRGRVDLRFASEQGISLRLTGGASPVWAGTISFTELAVWLVGPPLALWLVWLWWTGHRPGRRPTRTTRASVAPAQPRPGLGDGARPATYEGAVAHTPERVGVPVDPAG